MSQTDPKNEPASDEYYGFSLKSICWGYRDIFRDTIDRLLDEGVLGEDRPETTESFFSFLKNADQSCYDHVLRRFLGAINPQTQWLLDLPGIFSDLVDLGRLFATGQPHHGVVFFECLGEGGFGSTPEEVRAALTRLRRLREINPELALAFLKGYPRLLERLTLDEIDTYLDAGLSAYSRNRKAGLAFMEGTLESSETYLASITQECRLCDISSLLESLLRALTGTAIEVDTIAKLDSDDLLERGTTCVGLYQWLYLPTRTRRFGSRELNRSWYKLCGVVSAALWATDSFPRIHGHPDFATLTDMVGPERSRLNLVQIAEFARAVRHIRGHWPGAVRLVDFGLATEFRDRPPANAAEEILRDWLGATEEQAADRFPELTAVMQSSVNIFDTVERIARMLEDGMPEWGKGLERGLMRPFSFAPDFLFPGTVSSPPQDSLIADLKHAAEESAADDQDGAEAEASANTSTPSGDEYAEDEEQEPDGEGIQAGYVYDEWSNEENDYLRGYCLLHQIETEVHPGTELPADVLEEGRRLSRVFERIKPDEARRERYLEDGDVINPDRLVYYLHQRRLEPSPKVDFYEKPRINRRDLAVTILIDASGSTGENADEGQKIIDVEKHAALILGQGLHTLGDRFAICGFSSNGRQNCIYSVYKDFGEAWEPDAMRRVLGATPANSTRIGPALRHTGWRMAKVVAKQRLIILITDGRPMDTGYDPNTRYAQQDVRVACEENARQSIHTFAISTEENSIADMEIMFPGRRFAILADIRHLPKVLPRLYTRLTV